MRTRPSSTTSGLIALTFSVSVAACGPLDPHPEGPLGEDLDPAEVLVPLVNGTPITNLSGAAGSERPYALVVPSGATNLSFSIAGTSGDADLYVRFGAAPTTSTWDYRPYLASANERVVPTEVKAGTWYLMVRGYSAYSALTVTASFTPPASAPPPRQQITLANGLPVTQISATTGGELQFSLEVPDGASGLVFRTAGGRDGDLDLYVRRGAAPTTTAWDYRPYTASSEETVSPAAPLGGTWYVMVRAYKTFSGATLTASFTPPGTSLEERVLVLVNQRRAEGATCGGVAQPPVPPLAMNEALRTSARLHSADMAARGYFAHDSQDGRTFDARIRDAGYTGAPPWGENIAAGQTTAESVVDGWMASPGHCTNIMSSSFRAVGIGYAFQSGSPYLHYWTQDFGGE